MSLMRNFVYSMSTKVVFGVGKRSEIGEEAKQLGRKAFLVTGRKAMKKLGVTENIVKKLNPSGVDAVVYDKVEANPSQETVQEGAELAKKENCDLVIALGGGSAMDAAKGIATVAVFGGKVWNYIGEDKIPGLTLPLIAIPTTAGTGSEVTPYSVLSDKEKKLKEAIVSPHIFPRVAIVDPELMTSAPPFVVASTGMDTLSHAIEAYISNFAQPISDMWALNSIRLCAKNLRVAALNPKNLEAQCGMSLASTLAGVAIANADTVAVHVLGEAVGAYHNIAHGAAIGILLPYVMEYNLCSNLSKFAKIAKAMGESVDSLSERDAASKAVDAIRQLITDIPLPTRLKEFGVTEESIPHMAKYAMRPGMMAANSRVVTEDDVVKLFERAF